MVRHATVGVFRDPGVGANRSRQCLVEPPIYSLAIVAELQQKKKNGERFGGAGCCLCPRVEIILNQMLLAAVFNKCLFKFRWIQIVSHRPFTRGGFSSRNWVGSYMWPGGEAAQSNTYLLVHFTFPAVRYESFPLLILSKSPEIQMWNHYFVGMGRIGGIIAFQEKLLATIVNLWTCIYH